MKILFNIALLFFISCSVSSEKEFHCPNFILEESAIKNLDSEWTTYNNSQKKYFDRVDVLSGLFIHDSDSINELGTLVPDNPDSHFDSLKSTWTLISSKKENYYIGCRYKKSTTLLIQKIPKNFNSCSDYYQKPKYDNELKFIKLICSKKLDL